VHQWFHIVIDNVTLGLLRRQAEFSWTRLDKYHEYLRLQTELRALARSQSVSPLELECTNWNEQR
jgi:hypothetical protein